MTRVIHVPMYYDSLDTDSGDYLQDYGWFYYYSPSPLTAPYSAYNYLVSYGISAANIASLGYPSALNTLANVPTTRGTVMFFVYPESLTGAIFYATEDDFTTGIIISVASGNFTASKGTTASYDTAVCSLTVFANNWYHIAYTWDDDIDEHRLLVYRVATTTLTDSGTQSQTKTQPTCEFFSTGNAIQFRAYCSLKVFDTVLSPAEIATERTVFPSTPNPKPTSYTLKHRLKLFTNALEEVSNTNATVSGDVQFKQSDKPTSNQAVASTLFNETATNGVVYTSGTTPMDTFDIRFFTLMFWHKATFDWTPGSPANYYHTALRSVVLGVETKLDFKFLAQATPQWAVEIVQVGTSNYTDTVAVTSLSATNDWAHYAFVFDAEAKTVTIYQYVGGSTNVATDTTYQGITPQYNDQNVIVNSRVGLTSNAEGYYLDHKIFNGCLTADEIATERWAFSETQALQDYLLTTDIGVEELVDQDLLPATQNSLNTQRITIYNEDGQTPLDLSDGDGETTITGWIKPYRKSDRAITGTLSVVSGSETDGLIDWTYSSVDTSDSGEHYVQFKIVNTDSTSGYTYITKPRYWNVYRDFSD